MVSDRNRTKATENRLRRAAARQGLRLEKSRMRDPRGLGYGTYRLVDARTGKLVAGNRRTGYGLTLFVAVVSCVTSGPESRSRPRRKNPRPWRNDQPRGRRSRCS